MENELYFCFKCKENFDDGSKTPKKLNCGHVFCFNCILSNFCDLKNIMNNIDYKINCFICKELTTVEKIELLKTDLTLLKKIVNPQVKTTKNNYTSMRLKTQLEKNQIIIKPNDKVKNRSSSFSKQDEIQPKTKQIQRYIENEDKSDLKNEAIIIANDITASNLKLINKDESVSKINSFKLSNSKLYCLQHSKELDGYCNDCSQLICMNCILEGDHKSHELTTIFKGNQKFIKTLEDVEPKILEAKKAIDNTLLNLKKEENKLHAFSKQKIANIQNFYKNVISIIQEREQILIKRIIQIKENEIQRYLSFETGLKKQMSILDTVNEKKSSIISSNDETINLSFSKEIFSLLTFGLLKIPEVELAEKVNFNEISKKEEYDNLMFILKKRVADNLDGSEKISSDIIIEDDEPMRVEKEVSLLKKNKVFINAHKSSSLSNFNKDHKSSFSKQELDKLTFINNKDKDKENSLLYNADQTQFIVNYVDVDLAKVENNQEKAEKIEKLDKEEKIEKQENLKKIIKKVSIENKKDLKPIKKEDKNKKVSFNKVPKIVNLNLIESNEIKSVEIDEISKLDIKNEDLTNLSIELFLDDEDWKKENVLSSPYKENDENDKSNFNMFDNSIRSVNKSIITISNSIYKINKSFILIVGGKSDSKTYKYDLENGVFEEKKELLLEKSDFNLVPYKNKILVLGGRRVIDQYEQIEDTIEIIDWRENNIKKLKNKLKTQRYSFGSAYINSCLFVLGGFNGKEVVNSNECFSKQTSKWEELQKMRVKKKEFSCVLVDKNLFIIGGSDEKENILKSCDKFDLETQKWTKIDDLIVPRKAGQCLLMPDGLYMIGGFDGNSYLKSCEKYEFSTKKWKSIAPMLQARSHFSANATSNYCYIYCFGGYDGKSLNSIERYDVMKQKWFNSGKLPNSKYRHQSIIIEDN